MRRLIYPFSKLCVVAALFVAMAGSGFAHRTAPPPRDNDLRAYLAAGGTLADVCGDFAPGDHAGGPCDACRLVKSAIVPVIASAAIAVLGAARPLYTVPKVPLYHPSDADPARMVRAPPTV